MPGSGVTSPNGTIDDTSRVELYTEMIKKTEPTETSRVPDKMIREMTMKKVSRVFDVQKNQQVKNNFTGIPGTDMRASFNRSTWSPAKNMQQPPLGTLPLLLVESLTRVLQKLRTS